MAIDAVGDIISEAVAEHPFPISFPYTVALTQPAERVPAGVRAFFFYAQTPQGHLHISARLDKELPSLRGFSARNLRYMRMFYEEWSDLDSVSGTALIEQSSNLALASAKKQ